MRLRTPLFGCGFAAAMALAAAPAGAVSNYTISFDDHEALSWVYAQARDTFAYWTTQRPDGKLQISASSPSSNPPGPPYEYDDWTRWDYSQRIGTNGSTWFDVFPYELSHYHLDFEDQSYQTCPNEGNPNDGYGYGLMKKVNGQCVLPADYAAEHRYLKMHQAGEWITMSAQSMSTGQYQAFHANSIQLVGPANEQRGNTVPLQAWGLGTDGSWYSQKQIGVRQGGSTYTGWYVINFSIYYLQEFDVGPDDSYTGQESMNVGAIVVGI